MNLQLPAQTDNPQVLLRSDDGTSMRMNLHRWLESTCPVDDSLLDRAVGPVLDVGCGPGRHVAALAGRGVMAMGVDASSHAVEIANGRGVPVLRRSIFDPLPGTGRWATLLILDGSIGIGGDPSALLNRGADLLRAGGRILLEIEQPGTPSRVLNARLESGGQASAWFPWAVVSLDSLQALASASGLRIMDTWTGGSRWFASLVKP